MAKKDSITQSRLKELLNYDPETGAFYWLASRGMKKAGARADKIKTYKCGHQVRVIKLEGKRYYANQIAWLYIHGWAKGEVDHIDRNPLNNRLSNLRDVSKSANCLNRGMRSDNLSGFTGVSKKRNKWMARFKKKYLGTFDSIDDAVHARKVAEVRDPDHPRTDLTSYTKPCGR